MTFTFQSHELVRVLTVDDVHYLGLDEARRFNAELTIAIESLTDSITSAKAEDVPPDANWMHRVQKKRRIATAFAAEVRRHLAKLDGTDQRTKFLELRYERLLALLRDEFEEQDVIEMDQEAREAAEKDLNEWLATSERPQVFVP